MDANYLYVIRVEVLSTPTRKCTALLCCSGLVGEERERGEGGEMGGEEGMGRAGGARREPGGVRRKQKKAG